MVLTTFDRRTTSVKLAVLQRLPVVLHHLVAEHALADGTEAALVEGICPGFGGVRVCRSAETNLSHRSSPGAARTITPENCSALNAIDDEFQVRVVTQCVGVRIAAGGENGSVGAA